MRKNNFEKGSVLLEFVPVMGMVIWVILALVAHLTHWFSAGFAAWFGA